MFLDKQNGESIALYYNPVCLYDGEVYGTLPDLFAQNQVCANFIFDLNGTKGPNQMGKDIGFVTALYKTDTVVVAPLPATENASTDTLTYTKAVAACKSQDSDLRLPDRDELAAMFINESFLPITSDYYWSGSVASAGSSAQAWYQGFGGGDFFTLRQTNNGFVRCVWK